MAQQLDLPQLTDMQSNCMPTQQNLQEGIACHAVLQQQQQQRCGHVTGFRCGPAPSSSCSPQYLWTARQQQHMQQCLSRLKVGQSIMQNTPDNLPADTASCWTRAIAWRAAVHGIYQ
jgi:hypothetical protein